MKYLLLVTMFIASAVFADEDEDANVLSKQVIKIDKKERIYLRTICIDGYKFFNSYRLTVGGMNDYRLIGFSTVQMFENQNGVSVPSEC